MARENGADELDSSQSLRERAKALLRTSRKDLAGMATEEVQALLNELQVHQMELEIQNEELREAQVALAESHDRYADLYEFAPVGYVTLDHDGRILEANLTAAVVLGVDRQELAGARLTSFVAREDQDRFYHHRRTVFESEAKQVCELCVHPTGGDTRTVRLESIALGTLRQPRGVCRTALIDVTDRERISDELRQLNESLEQRVAEQTRGIRLLAEAVSNLGEGVLITDAEDDWQGSKIVFVNEMMRQITGFSAEELVGQTPAILHAAATNATTLDRITTELSAKCSCSVELIQSRKNGAIYDVELFITPLLDADRRCINYVSIHRDITAKKQAECALRVSEQRLDLALSATGLGLWDRDLLTGRLDVNERWAAMLGYELNEVRPHHDAWEAMVHPMDLDLVRRALDAHLAGRMTHFTAEYRMRTKSGHWIWIESHGQIAERDAGGNPIRLIGTHRDISERREAHQQLAEYQRNLRLLAVQIMEVEEKERRRLAVDLHDGLGQLLNLARMKLGALEHLPQFAALSDPLSELAELLNQAVRQAGSLTFELSPPVLHELGLVAACQWLAEEMHHRYGLAVEVRDGDGVGALEDNLATVMFRAVRELLINVSKHAGVDHATVTLRQEAGVLEAVVTDDGVGIDPGLEMGRLLSQPGRGGFGLFSIRERMEHLGGRLDIRSMAGRGTEVCLVTPINPSDRFRKEQQP